MGLNVEVAPTGGVQIRGHRGSIRRKPSAGFGPGTRCARSLRSRACVVRVPEAGLALSVHQDAGWFTGCPWWTEKASGTRDFDVFAPVILAT
jgi:hypothetical protein